MKKLNIAIVGLGNIGSYLYKYLKNNKKILAKKNNCTPNIIHVSARNKNRVLLDKLVDILLNQETIDNKVFKLTTSKLLKV